MRCGGPALCSECAADAYRARAALAQPSGEVVVTKNESGAIVSVTRQDKEGRVLSVIAESATLTAQAEQAEAERPEVFGLERYRVEKTGQGFWPYCVRAGDGTRELFVGHLKQCKRVAAQLATAFEDGKFIAQHESIVGGLRAEITQLRQHKNDYMDAGQETYRALQNEIREREAEIARLDGLVSGHTAERDAALARVAELEAALSSALSQHGIKFMDPPDGGDTPLIEQVCRMSQALAELEKQESVAWVEVIDRDYGPYKFYGKRLLPKGKHQLYAAPVAQTQHSVPVAREQLERLVRILDAHNYAKDAEALMALLAAAPAQAQHCVPELLVRAEDFVSGKEVPQAWLDVQAERRRQITAEGWTPEHDDLYCAAELPRAAAAYILNGANDEAPAIWPFSAKWWKPRDARSNYVRAGALILAEIERLDRAAHGKEVGHE